MTLRVSDLLAQWRWATRRELTEVAAEIGIGSSTLSRLEKGGTPDGETLTKVMRWVLGDAAQPPARPGQLMLEDHRDDGERSQ